jgi:YidC/Oxa1 family membrane protein insertase
VSFSVNNPTNSDFRANAFGQIKRDAFDDPSSSGGFGRTYLGYVSTNEEDPYIEIDFDDIDDGANSFETMGGWIGFSQHYFISAWVPDSNTVNRYTTRKNNLNQYFGEFTGSAFDVPATSSASYQMQFYAGPKDQYVLADISPNLDLTIDYSFLWFLAAPIYWLLRQLDSLIGNYGLSIIVLTIIVKGAFYKLSETQYKSMAGMRRLMPKMQQLKESYGDDRMKLQQATMELYKKEKINPFGGCLPVLVQMPVFIALYWVLLESVELRHAPFILWLQDLSVRDPFFILPLLMGATMYLQTTLSPAPADPMQAKVMKLMPIMMTVLFLWFPAGLVLYWLTNGLLGILQQWYITRKIEAAYEAKAAK